MNEFYGILDRLKERCGGERVLFSSTGRMRWPTRGIYFFMEPGERRSNARSVNRVVRIGTHALTSGSKSTLWGRLSQHKGHARSKAGNHRGSIFRLIVGTALNDGQNHPTWGAGSSAPRETRDWEIDLERAVTQTIGAMPFLYLEIDDEAGPASKRGYIERNCIALLSNYEKPSLDPPSPSSV